MKYVERELNRVTAELQAEPKSDKFAELYAAQQALAWSLDPTVVASPIKQILGDKYSDLGVPQAEPQ